MFVRYARMDERSLIRDHWKEIFAHDDFGTIDLFFNRDFNPKQAYVVEKDGAIVGGLMVFFYDMKYQDEWLRVAFLSGVYTLEAHRHQGIMTFLLKEVLKQLDHQVVFTLLRAYSPDLYKPFGFEPVIYQQESVVKRSQIPIIDSRSIRFSLDYAGLVDIYNYYGQYFNGYFRRTEKDFMDLHEEMRVQGGDMFSLEVDGVVQGYLAYYENDGQVVAKEVIYRDGQGLLTLLNYLLSIRSVVKVVTPQAMPLSLFIDHIQTESQLSHLVRLNRPDLFNRLFNVKVSHAHSAMTAFGKPLFNVQE